MNETVTLFAVYREFAPPSALDDALECLWVRVADGAAPVRVLPDACVDVIWQSGRGAFVAGPDTAAQVAELAPGSVLVGARFLPGAGGPALRTPLDRLRDARVDLRELMPRLAQRLPGELPPDAALRLLPDVAARLVRNAAPDPAVRAAARRLGDPSARIDRLAGDVGLGERQLRRRFHAAVGYGPKTLQRVLRFRRFLDGADAGIPLARLAVDAGYADQSHLTRECSDLAGMAPAALIRTRARHRAALASHTEA